MNKGFFTGRVAKAPTLREGGQQPVCYVTLIRNEYAGKDQGGDATERQVSISFTSFDKKAKAIAEHVCVGDQLIVEYRLANNNREVEGKIDFGFSFILEEFEFGAPGEIKRERLAQAKGTKA